MVNSINEPCSSRCATTFLPAQREVCTRTAAVSSTGPSRARFLFRASLDCSTCSFLAYASAPFMRMPLVPTQVASCSTLLHTALRSPFRALLVYFFSFGWNRLTGSPQGWPKKPRSVIIYYRFEEANKRTKDGRAVCAVRGCGGLLAV